MHVLISATIGASDEKVSALPFLFALASAPIYAAPFVVSDPYPPDAAQPTEFVITVSGTQTPVIVPATATPQGVILKWDVAAQEGSKTITVKARNMWGGVRREPPFLVYSRKAGRAHRDWAFGPIIRLPK